MEKLAPEPETKPEQDTPSPEAFDDEWFARGERTSAPPPSSRRPSAVPGAAPSAPADPIGDSLADTWFR